MDFGVNFSYNFSKSCVDSKTFKSIIKNFSDYRVLSQQLAPVSAPAFVHEALHLFRSFEPNALMKGRNIVKCSHVVRLGLDIIFAQPLHCKMFDTRFRRYFCSGLCGFSLRLLSSIASGVFFFVIAHILLQYVK